MARATAGGDALVAVALALLSRPSVAPTVRCVALRRAVCGVLVLALAPRRRRRGVDEGGGEVAEEAEIRGATRGAGLLDLVLGLDVDIATAL